MTNFLLNPFFFGLLCQTIGMGVAAVIDFRSENHTEALEEAAIYKSPFFYVLLLTSFGILCALVTGKDYLSLSTFLTLQIVMISLFFLMGAFVIATISTCEIPQKSRAQLTKAATWRIGGLLAGSLGISSQGLPES